MNTAEVLRIKTIGTPRGRTCPGGGSVREEGRAAPLSSRADRSGAHMCSFSS